MIEQRRILASVELLFQAKVLHVKWLDQVVNGEKVISEAPHRRAFSEADMQEIPDPEHPFAAAALIADRVSRFADKLTKANQDLGAAQARIEELGASLEEARGQTAAESQSRKLAEDRATELAEQNAALRSALAVKVAEVEALAQA